MTRIVIKAKDLEGSLSANVSSGTALLIGRAPDPTRLDWSALASPQAVNLPSSREHYRLITLTVQAGRSSANHLLVLRDGGVTALHDLGSRNGSWVRIDPQRPVVLAGELEISLSLGGLAAQELRPTGPKPAEWAEEEDFAAAVLRALTAWAAQLDLPVQLTQRAADRETNDLLLADGSVVEVKLLGTLQFSQSLLIELIAAYIHDQNVRFQQMRRRVSGMIADSPAIRQVLLRTAEAAANSRRTILLGPTGAGKELLARSYHGYSPRHAAPFVTVNCALLEKELLFAQLFGARRGSYTGAVADVAGLVEAADRGTLFLDELGEMNLEVQKALLRFLDSSGEYHRLGDPRARRADVQIVCASNAPIDDPEYRKGRFRDDLWYRLSSSVITVPPLRERPEDIRGFLNGCMLGGSSLRVSDCLTEDAMAFLLKDPWPGNFRDLANFTDRLPADAQPRSIDRLMCERIILQGRPKAAASSTATLDAQKPKEPSGRSAARLRMDPLLPTNRELGWEQVMQTALTAFQEDQGDETAGWDQLHLLIERYLKPMFVAHAAKSIQPPTAGRALNYSALARRLHISDGSTVKTHLGRFEERFTPVP